MKTRSPNRSLAGQGPELPISEVQYTRHTVPILQRNYLAWSLDLAFLAWLTSVVIAETRPSFDLKLKQTLLKSGSIHLPASFMFAKPKHVTGNHQLRGIRQFLG